VGVLSPAQVNSTIISKILRSLDIERVSTTDLTFYGGVVAGMDDGSTVVELPSNTTLDISTTGKNGLDTGSVAALTWYYLFLIWNEDTDEVATLASLSKTNPTMPSGFTHKRWVGANRTDGGPAWVTFEQNMLRGFMAPTTISGSGSVDISLFVPDGARSIYLSATAYAGNNSAAGVQVNGVYITRERLNWTLCPLSRHDEGCSRWCDIAENRIISVSRWGTATIQCHGYNYESI
jgi:hypothetical protein